MESHDETIELGEQIQSELWDDILLDQTTVAYGHNYGLTDDGEN